MFYEYILCYTNYHFHGFHAKQHGHSMAQYSSPQLVPTPTPYKAPALVLPGPGPRSRPSIVGAVELLDRADTPTDEASRREERRPSRLGRAPLEPETAEERPTALESVSCSTRGQRKGWLTGRNDKDLANTRCLVFLCRVWFGD